MMIVCDYILKANGGDNNADKEKMSNRTVLQDIIDAELLDTGDLVLFNR